MIETPESIRALMMECATEHADDIKLAAKTLEERARKLKEFPGIVNALLEKYFTERIYEARHNINSKIKRKATWVPPDNPNRHYGGNKTKVSVADSPLVNKAGIEMYLDYCIGGRTLGSLTGADLAVVADEEHAVSKGHEFNSRLAAYLAARVPFDVTVSEKFNEKQITKVWKRIRSGVYGTAGA